MTTRPTVRAANGLVASGHHLATAAGLAALRDGGNAVDAAVTAAAVCAVVMPHRTSMGGDLFALVYDARSREVSAYNGSGAAPHAIDTELFGAGYPDQGPAIATVPGAIGGLADLAADHGRLGLDRALAPAIAYAESGFPVSDVLAEATAEQGERLARDAEATKVFGPRGRWPRAGEMLQQPDLAATLRSVASDGADAFYRGELGEKFATAMASIGGAMDRADLAAHRTDRPGAISVEYRGLRVFGQPPVSQGHVLLEELAIAEGLELRSHEWGGAELVHLMVEMKKLAFADRDAHAGDPAHVDFDARRLLDPGFVASRRRALNAKASERSEAGSLMTPADTTYLAVVDRDGNAVSLIESVFSAFGAACVVPGTGILLNNRLIGFSLDPGSPNALAPGKRPVHTLNTVVVLDGSMPRFVFGTPGRHAQVQTNFQLAVGLIDFGMDVQRAIDEPRWYHDSGRTLKMERRYPEAVRRALAAKGHEVAVLGDWDEMTGGAQAIAIEPNGAFAGGADPRREGQAAGY
ncbi:MAG TPA: gamma-glutamyltransferase [Candidatus Limnocylindria bacterium]|nr:gamma-glutamyltransferase [Candidatus Limnocylindria bacterium]